MGLFTTLSVVLVLTGTTTASLSTNKPAGTLFATVGDYFKDQVPYAPSTKCSPGCTSGSHCCYDPAQGEDSFACFSPRNNGSCADIVDTTAQSYIKLDQVDFEEAQYHPTRMWNCTDHKACEVQRVTQAGNRLYQQLQYRDNAQAFIITFDLTSNKSAIAAAMCPLETPMAMIFGDKQRGTLYGIQVDGVSMVKITAGNASTCTTQNAGTLPMPVLNASNHFCAPPTCTYNSSSQVLYCVGERQNPHPPPPPPPPMPPLPTCPEIRDTVFSYDVANKKSLQQWKFDLELGYLQMDLSQDRILLGGQLMCGQKQGDKCLISLDTQSGEKANIALEAPPGEQLGVLYAASEAESLVLYQTHTAQTQGNKPQVVALDWKQLPGQQVRFNSSYMPIPCAKGSYSCETTGYLYVDAP